MTCRTIALDLNIKRTNDASSILPVKEFPGSNKFSLVKITEPGL